MTHYPEKLFRKNFVSWFKQFYPNGHIQNIESEATSAGIPDINACKGGKDIWVELKSGPLTKASIKPGQFIWHIKRNQAGGTTWLVQRTDNGRIRIYRGNRIKEFRERPNAVEPDAIFDSNEVQERIELFEYLFQA